MTERRNVILAALFALQLALILIAYSPFSNRAGLTEARALLPALQGVTPAKIEIEDAEGNTVVLVKEGDGWGLEALDGYPVDPEKVDQVLDNLKQAKVRRPTVTSSRYHRALKVAEDDFERRVRVWPAGDTDAPVVDLLLGTSPSYRLTHARVVGEDAVYEVAGLAPFDLRPEPSAWVENKLVDVDADQVVRLEVRNPKGRFEVEKADDGTWKVVQPSARSSLELDADKVKSFIRWAGSLWIAKPAGALAPETMGFDQPYAMVALTLHKPEPTASSHEEENATSGPDSQEAPGAEEGSAAGAGARPASSTQEEGQETEDRPAPPAELETIVVKIGSPVPDAEGERYIMREGFGYAATVRESSIQQLAEKTLADLEAK